MGAIGRALGAEWRRRWTSWVALSILVALVGGTVMAGAVAARRTAAAVPGFARTYGADVAVFGTEPVSHLTNLPGESARITSDLPAYINADVRFGSTLIPSSDLSVLGMDGFGVHHAVKLLSGRWPTAPNDVLMGFSLQQLTGAHVGTVIHVPLYASWEASTVYSSPGTPPAHGPDVALRVVGVSATMLDFPTIPPSYTMIVSKAFATTYRSVLTAHLALFRLKDGASGIPRFNYDVNHLPSANAFYYPYPFDGFVSAIEGSIRPQAAGWWLFSLLALVAGLALLGQALARQSLVEREAFPTLSALGFTPNQLFWVGLLRGTIIGVLGAIGATTLAFLVSPLTPVGEARAAATTVGFAFDARVLVLGLVAVVVVTVLLAIYPSWRAAQVRQLNATRDRTGRPSALASAAARSGAPPTVLIGMRHAFEAGRGRSRVPVATALFGTAAAVCALSATSVFGASLTTLLHTPALYGQNWNLEFNSLTSKQVHSIVAASTALSGVVDVGYGVSGKSIDVNGASTNLLLVRTAKGDNPFVRASGSLPTTTGEIALGSATLAAAHAKVGDRVAMTVIGPTGKARTGAVLVTGTTVFPEGLGLGTGLGDGAIATLDEAYSFLCGTTNLSAPCARSLTGKLYGPQFNSWGVVIRTAATPAGDRARKILEQRYSKQLAVIFAPTNLVNFGAAVNFPLLLGAMAALFGAAALVHLLLVSVARRRRELALLKVLGFQRRQAAATVCWQSATVSFVGVLVGIPLGIAIGRVVWGAYVNSLGAVPSSVVPIVALVAVGFGALACSVLFAAIPAALAARLGPAEALREA